MKKLDITSDTLAAIGSFIDDFPTHSEVLGGDLNHDMSVKSDSSILLNNFFKNNNLQLCGKEYSSNVNILNFTYQHASLPHSSYIDYFAVSETILKDIVDFDIIGSGVNLSDHNPISQSYFLSSDRQFGFKRGVGCSDAINTVRKVVDYFANNLGISFSRCRNTSVQKPTCPQKESTLRWGSCELV